MMQRFLRRFNVIQMLSVILVRVFGNWDGRRLRIRMAIRVEIRQVLLLLQMQMLLLQYWRLLLLLIVERGRGKWFRMVSVVISVLIGEWIGRRGCVLLLKPNVVRSQFGIGQLGFAAGFEFDGSLLLARLDEIEKGVAQTKVPLTYWDYVYTLRSHIELVRAHITGGDPPADASLKIPPEG